MSVMKEPLAGGYVVATGGAGALEQVVVARLIATPMCRPPISVIANGPLLRRIDP